MKMNKNYWIIILYYYIIYYIILLNLNKKLFKWTKYNIKNYRKLKIKKNGSLLFPKYYGTDYTANQYNRARDTRDEVREV